MSSVSSGEALSTTVVVHVLQRERAARRSRAACRRCGRTTITASTVGTGTARPYRTVVLPTPSRLGRFARACVAQDGPHALLRAPCRRRRRPRARRAARGRRIARRRARAGRLTASSTRPRVYELQGMDQRRRAAEGVPGPARRRPAQEDPTRSGDPDWVSYNAQFYERRQTVPLAAYAIEPLAGDRAVLDVSLAGYVAAVLALFWLLRLRFRLADRRGRGHARHRLPARAHRACELSAHGQLGPRADDGRARVRGPRARARTGAG